MDFGLALKDDIHPITGKKLRLRIFTDSKSLFDVITKNASTTEKWFMVDVRPFREAHERLEFNDVD